MTSGTLPHSVCPKCDEQEDSEAGDSATRRTHQFTESSSPGPRGQPPGRPIGQTHPKWSQSGARPGEQRASMSLDLAWGGEPLRIRAFKFKEGNWKGKDWGL